MIYTLQPLKVRYGHSFSIQVEIRNNHNVPFQKNLNSFSSCWSIGGFGYDLGLDSGCTGFSQLLLIGSRDQYACFQDVSFVELCLEEAQDLCVLQLEVF